MFLRIFFSSMNEFCFNIVNSQDINPAKRFGFDQIAASLIFEGRESVYLTPFSIRNFNLKYAMTTKLSTCADWQKKKIASYKLFT